MTLADTLVSVVSSLATLPGVATLLIAGLLLMWLTQKKYKLPPGPPSLPLVGNLLDFRGTTPTKKTFEWKAKYGDVIQYKLGLRRWVVITSIEALNEAYIQRGVDFASKPYVPSLYVLSDNGANIAFAPYSEALRYRRKVAMQAMRQLLTGFQHTERIHKVVLTTVDNMTAQKGSFDPHRYISHTIFNLIHDICFGSSLAIDDAVYNTMLSFFDDRNLQILGLWEDVFPILLWCPTPKFRWIRERFQYFREYINKHLEDRRSNFKQDQLENLIDNILLAQKVVSEGEQEELKAGFTDRHIFFIIRDVFFAGVNTSRHALDWLFLVLATNQDVQNRIHREIDQTVGAQVPGREHRPGLVYTEAVIHEVMRLFPVTPMGLPHETMCDTKVGGYDIPAKTPVLINQYAIMRDPKHWDNPEEFRPERFIEKDGSKLKTRIQSWIPFSIGPRSCVGEFLARQNLLYSVVGLLQRLHFDLAPEIGKPDFRAQNTWFDLKPYPYKVVVTHRDR